jgi:hypothetical protein
MFRLTTANRLDGDCGVLWGYAEGLTAADDGDYSAYGDYVGGLADREDRRGLTALHE